jgi:adenosylhomocysteine nucleosidase
MKGKLILISAAPIEHGGLTHMDGIPIFQVGVGKISAASNLTEILWNEEPDIVVNFGSCGNLKGHLVGDLLEVGTVHNNIDARPFAEYGHTPFSRLGPIVLNPQSNIECFTTDQFYDSHRTDYSEKYLEMIDRCDIVDMECYALAQVCKQRNIPFYSYKWISDDGESDKWEENAAAGFKKFRYKLLEHFFGEY